MKAKRNAGSERGESRVNFGERASEVEAEVGLAEFTAEPAFDSQIITSFRTSVECKLMTA